MYAGRLSFSLVGVALLFVAACPPRAATLPPPQSVAAVAGPEHGPEHEYEKEGAAPFGPPRPDAELLEVAWAKALPALRVEGGNSGAKAEVHLYKADGSVDSAALDVFDSVAADSNGVFPLQPRLVQLAFKAARHFDARSLVVVSGYRKPPRRGQKDHHAKGEALDFRLPGVDYRKLAAYLRSLPRVGVGVYTDSRTRYVHLDVRETSFHWLDASPPGVTWREARLPDPHQVERDATYTEESDLPL